MTPADPADTDDEYVRSILQTGWESDGSEFDWATFRRRLSDTTRRYGSSRYQLRRSRITRVSVGCAVVLALGTILPVLWLGDTSRESPRPGPNGASIPSSSGSILGRNSRCRPVDTWSGYPRLCRQPPRPELKRVRRTTP
jgi:hypothetical protein